MQQHSPWSLHSLISVRSPNSGFSPGEKKPACCSTSSCAGGGAFVEEVTVVDERMYRHQFNRRGSQGAPDPGFPDKCAVASFRVGAALTGRGAPRGMTHRQPGARALRRITVSCHGIMGGRSSPPGEGRSRWGRGLSGGRAALSRTGRRGTDSRFSRFSGPITEVAASLQTREKHVAQGWHTGSIQGSLLGLKRWSRPRNLRAVDR